MCRICSASSTRSTRRSSASARSRRTPFRSGSSFRPTASAGVWAANANQKWRILDEGDVEKALATAQAIGDDRLQTAARGYAVPDSSTHGSSAARAKWLTTGLKSDQIASCNTFSQ